MSVTIQDIEEISESLQLLVDQTEDYKKPFEKIKLLLEKFNSKDSSEALEDLENAKNAWDDYHKNMMALSRNIELIIYDESKKNFPVKFNPTMVTE
jgi:hypothetical protein